MITDEEIACVALAVLQKGVGPIDRDRPLVLSALERIRARVQHALDQHKHHLVTRARGARKAAGADDKDDAALDYGHMGDAIRPDLAAIAREAAQLGMQQVDTAEIDALLSQANARAVEWARRRSGEMVKQVSETTRQAVADLTAQALEEGWSNDALADALDSSDVFGEDRADRIARTETAMADVQGNLIGWQESGLVSGKEWLVADANECDLCADLNGEIAPLDEEFPDGDPPLHPNCRCTVLPVQAAEDQGT